MGGKGRSWKASLVAVLLMGFMACFLFVGVLGNREVEKTKMTLHSSVKFDHLKLVAKDRGSVKWNLVPKYVSKRRVPTGPDPIHNRRIGKYKKPPGRI